MLPQISERITNAVIEDLRKRKGIGDAFDEVDDDVLAELTEELDAVVLFALREALR